MITKLCKASLEGFSAAFCLSFTLGTLTVEALEAQQAAPASPVVQRTQKTTSAKAAVTKSQRKAALPPSVPLDPYPDLAINVVVWNAALGRIPIKWAIDNKDARCSDSELADVSTDVAESGSDSTGLHPGSTSKVISCPHLKNVCFWINGTAGWAGPYSIPCQPKLVPQRFAVEGKVLFVVDPFTPTNVLIAHSVPYPFSPQVPELSHQENVRLQCVQDGWNYDISTDQSNACIAHADIK